MNKDLLINGEKFISAKRASHDLGYSTDYIGQLARSGVVSGKMVGRSWYVSRRSLVGYKKNGGSEKLVKVGRPAIAGKKDLYLQGEKFVSTGVAARETGYTTDYIGQLIRGGVVEGKMIGRSWYVSRKSLLGYKKNNSTASHALAVRQTPVVQRAALPKKVSTLSTLAAGMEKPKSVVKTFAYTTEAVRALPHLNKEKVRTNYSHAVRNVVSFSLSLTIILGVGYSWLDYLSPKTADAVRIHVAEALDTTEGFKAVVDARVAEVFRPVKVGSSHMALAIGSNIKGFFSGILSGVLPSELPVAGSAPVTKPGKGIVVTQENGDHNDAVQRIKNIFSDQVFVSGDPDGASGVITPVFTSSTSSEQYTYVLVPINEQKSETN